MKEVFQTIISPTEGNCLQAAIASLFEFELEEVPTFRATDWRGAMYDWLFARRIGWMCIVFPNWHYIEAYLERNKQLDVECLLAVQSFHYDCLHSVVARIRGGTLQVIHDPNPKNDILPIEEYKIHEIDLFFALDSTDTDLIKRTIKENN